METLNATIPRPSRAWLVAAIALTMLTTVLPTPTLAQSGASPDEAGAEPLDASYLSRPYKLETIAGDPFGDGVWLGTSTTGLFFRPTSGGAMQLEGVLDGVPDGHIFDIEPRPDHVWIATEAGPAALDRATGEWITFTTPTGEVLDGLSRVVHATDGQAWAGTDNDGLFELDPTTATATPVPNPVNGTRFNHPLLGIDDDGPLLYLGVAGYGLVEWNRSSDGSQRYGEGLYTRQPNYGRVLVHGPDVWVATSGDGVIRWNRSTDDVKAYIGPTTVNAKTVLDMVAVGDEIWFAGMGGAARYNTAEDHWKVYDRKTDAYHWSNPTDITLAAGTVVATTRLEGEIVAYDRGEDAFERQAWWTDRQVPSFNGFLDCDASDDRLLLATSGGGALFYEPDTGLWSRVGTHVGTTGNPADVFIREVLEDGDTLWFATSQGVSSWDRSTDAWDTYRTDGRGNVTMVPNEVYDLAATEDAVWAASFSSKPHTVRGEDAWRDGNLARYDRATGTWRNITTDDGLPGPNVTNVETTPEGLWLGFAGEGLAIHDPEAGTFEHVWPPDQDPAGVMDLVVGGDAIYIATLVHGVVRVDRTTRTSETVFDPGVPVITLEWDDGRIWVGTPGRGIHAVDPSTGESQAYHSGAPEDLYVQCFLRQGDVLYVGTQWGLRRLHLPTERWLPAVLDPTAPVDPRLRTATISITEPAAETQIRPGQAITITGTASSSPNTTIQVRLGELPWRTLEAAPTWNISLTAPDGDPGGIPLRAQLVHDGTPIAQALRSLQLTTETGSTPGGSSPASDVRIDHRPRLERPEGQPVTFTITASRAVEELEGTLILWRPGAEAPDRIPMRPASETRRTAEVEGFEQPGQARYRIEVSWADGSARLPSPESGFSDTYPLTIRAVEGAAQPRLSDPGEPTPTSAGTETGIELTLQNVGTRSGRMTLTLGGPAADWSPNAPDVVEVGPAASNTLTLTLDVPPDTPPGSYDLTVTAETEDGGARDTAIYTLEVQAAEDPTGTPGPPIALLFAALGLALGAANRRRAREP